MPTADDTSTETKTHWHRLRTQTDDDTAPIATAQDMKLFKPTPARHSS